MAEFVEQLRESKYAKDLVQEDGIQISADPSTWKCADSGQRRAERAWAWAGHPPCAPGTLHACVSLRGPHPSRPALLSHEALRPALTKQA